MRGVNKCILLGNVGSDIELRHTTSGSAVANFRMATNERYFNKQTEQAEERTEWHTVVCFNRLAELASEYLGKGSAVYVDGKLQTREWETQNGDKRRTTEILAKDIQFLDRGDGSGRSRTPQPEEQNPGNAVMDDSTVPF